jgi:fumarate reductase flavoprotein subunit
MDKTYDVIVVGGGGSGLAAAVSAAEHGAKVLVLEKQPQLGGTTGIAVGSFTANGTIYQRKASIQDNPGDHEEDTGKFAPTELEARNNAVLRQYFLSQTAETLHWLMEMGLAFYGPSPEPPNRVPRMHNVIPGAKAYIATLQAKLLRLGGTIVTEAPAEQLQEDCGCILGVVAKVNGVSMAFRATRGVVLAAGDYANSPELIAEYKGKRYAQIEGINSRAGGDGQRLAASVGAELVNMDITYGPEIRFVPPANKGFAQLLPAKGSIASLLGKAMPLVPRSVVNGMIKRLLVVWQHPENALFSDGAILINRDGERFCNEKLWPDREIAIAAQPGKVCYLLLDRRLVERYSAWPHYISTAPEIAYAYVADYLRLRPDVTVAAQSLREVAERREIPVEPLQAAITAYNHYATGAEQDVWGRTGDTAPMEPGRWVLLGPAKAYFTTTEGGAAVNQRLQVLDRSGQPIRGLYAVGQNGLGGQVLWAHGLHIGWAMTSGRLVGKVLMGKQPA